MIPLVYHASYSLLALPDSHRFPRTKYQALYHYLLQQQLAVPDQFFAPAPVTYTQLCTVHNASYVQSLLTGNIEHNAMRRIGFPWSESLITRTLHSIAGTALCASLAKERGIAIHLSGGYHHAHHDFGSGYCLFNDLIFAATQALQHPDIDTVLIFDCDVHQGDGTATMSHAHEGIISCSIHCRENFPARKQSSHYDVELKKGAQDEDYLQTVEQTLQYLIRLHQPDLILYDAGVDIHNNDDLGHLQITNNGIYQRDYRVLSQAKAAKIPIAAVIGGGYSKDTLELVIRHSQLFLAANQIWPSTN